MYWQGCELSGLYPVSVVADDIALNITLISRHDFVDFGLIACRKTLPHVQRMLEHLEQALVDLEHAALALTQITEARKHASRTRKRRT